MSKRDTRPIEVGDRFETRDARDAGRIVEVDELLGVADANQRCIDELLQPGARVPSWAVDIDEAVEYHRLSGTRFRIRTEVHPRNPSAEGTVRIANERTLRTKYKRVSR